MLQNQVGTDRECDLSSLRNDPYASVRDTLLEWQNYPANWDQCSSKKPNRTSIQSALRFLRLVESSAHTPEPMLHDTGRAGLFYGNDDIYADIEFLEDGSVAYYVDAYGQKDKGIFDLTHGRLPHPLSDTLSILS